MTDPAGAGIWMLTWLGFFLMGSMAHHIWQHHGSVMGYGNFWVWGGFYDGRIWRQPQMWPWIKSLGKQPPPSENPTKIKMWSKSQPGYSPAIKWGCLASGFQHLTMFLYKSSITQFKGGYTTWGDYRIIVDSCLQKPKVSLWPVAGVTSDFLGVESPISLTFSAPQKSPKDPNMYPKLERSKNLQTYVSISDIIYNVYIYMRYTCV
jgi:hypothetical protein